LVGGDRDGEGAMTRRGRRSWPFGLGRRNAHPARRTERGAAGGEAAAMPHADRMLLGLTVALIVTGLVWVYSASAMLAVTHHETSLTFLIRQSERVLVGFVCLAAGARIDYTRYHRHWLA